MGSFAQLPFLVGEGLRQFLRFRINSLAVLLTTAVTLFLLAVTVSGFATLDRVLEVLKADLVVAVYLEDGGDPAQREAMITALRARAGVVDVRLRDEAEALRSFREMLGTEVDELFAYLEGNPLPASLVVRCAEPGAARDLVRHIRETWSLQISEVHYGGMVYERMSALVHLLRVIAGGLLTFMLLATVALVTTSVAINLQSRREEIEIMQLVGATRSFIATPHLVEALILACLAMILAVFALYGVKGLALDALAGRLPVARSFLQGVPSLQALVSVALIGGTILAASTAMALRRYLR